MAEFETQQEFGKMDLVGKKIIVTGGSQGIGASAVRAFVTAGADVFSLDIKVEMGIESARKATAAGPGTAKFLKCDVSDHALSAHQLTKRRGTPHTLASQYRGARHSP